jgi:hypothetical protein
MVQAVQWAEGEVNRRESFMCAKPSTMRMAAHTYSFFFVIGV